MANSPKISAVIPVYNRERYVGHAVESILAQTFSDFELLVIDDGSTDRSLEVARSYRDPRIHLVCNKTNEGVPKTRNKGVQLARGEYLAFLDSDDWACPERFAKQVAFLDSHPDHAAVGAWIVWMNEEGRSLKKIKRKALLPDEIAAQRLFQSGIENSASMTRTAILREYSHQEDYDLSSDFDLWARIAATHKLATLPEVLVRRRVHGGQITQEKAYRVQDRRRAIYAAQLRVLGVPFTDTDLEYHVVLRSMRKQRFAPDLAYVEWAGVWLQQLREANQQTLCYPEPAFSELLGRLWFKVCWHASTNLGWPVWRRFWRSPLRGSALRYLRTSVSSYLSFLQRTES